MNCLHLSETDRLATALAEGAALELYLTPKPGLVDLADCGSHPDLNLATMERSLQIVGDYLGELLNSLKAEEPFPRQTDIGQRAEQTMLRVLGTNTHKGYIFLSGLLLVARQRTPDGHEQSLRKAIGTVADEFFQGGLERGTHGGQVRGRFHAGGIVREAMSGLPALFDEALPAYGNAIKRGFCFTCASFAMLARLMQTVEDTTTLHRGGMLGLHRIRRDGRELERILDDRGEFMPYLSRLNRDYIRMNLSMGGVADMLGLAYGCLIARGDIALKPKSRSAGFPMAAPLRATDPSEMPLPPP